MQYALMHDALAGVAGPRHRSLRVNTRNGPEKHAEGGADSCPGLGLRACVLMQGQFS